MRGPGSGPLLSSQARCWARLPKAWTAAGGAPPRWRPPRLAARTSPWAAHASSQQGGQPPQSTGLRESAPKSHTSIATLLTSVRATCGGRGTRRCTGATLGAGCHPASPPPQGCLLFSERRAAPLSFSCLGGTRQPRVWCSGSPACFNLVGTGVFLKPHLYDL